MKYKNIELKVGEDSEAELSCSIEFNGLTERDDELLDDITDMIIGLFNDFESNVYVEQYTENLIGVRCTDITFDQTGVKLLTEIYHKLQNVTFCDLEPIVFIDVNIDSEEWFEREDGSEYNVDNVTLEEFLENIEY